jgi:DNA ligase-1
MRPMLAEHAPKVIKFPVYGSAKIDGIRAVIKGGRALTRTLKYVPNKFTQEYLSKSILDGLDGEVTVGPPHAKNVMQATTSGIMSFEGEPDFNYWVFDFWNNSTMPYAQRLALMERGFNDGALNQFPRIKLLQQVVINNEAELLAFEQVCLTQGYEGVVVRDPNGVYKYGRSTAREGLLLKLKRFSDGDAVVIGAEELLHNANVAMLDALGYTKRSSHADGKVPMDTLGALQVRDLKTSIEFNIGTGYSAAKRDELWTMYRAGTLLGLIAKYKHFEASGVKEAPRHPVFQGFRDPRDIGEVQ